MIHIVKYFIAWNNLSSIKINFDDNFWTVTASEYLNDQMVEKKITGNIQKMYEILESVLEISGNLIKDLNEKYTGESEYKKLCFFKGTDGLCLYEGIAYDDKVVIEESIFGDELSFYIYLFSTYDNACLSKEQLIGFQTPFSIFVEALEREGITLTGFESNGVDEDDLTSTICILEYQNGVKCRIKYPQRHTFEIDDNTFIEYSDEESLDIQSYDSDLLEILEAIHNNQIKDYISEKEL
ncbi:MAG: hypothetical protein MH132_03710 [Hydrotalea sp.]|nr:hypothetical protein [Hydrotalea sp.]